MHCTRCGRPPTHRCSSYMDVDLSTDLAALAPLVAPLISGHSDLAIGTRLGRGARVVRGPKREIISRLLQPDSEIHSGGGFLRCAVRLQGGPRRRRPAPASRTSPTPGGSSTPSCWCWPNASDCACHEVPWTGSTIWTAGLTSWPGRDRRSGHRAAAARLRQRLDTAECKRCGAARFLTRRRARADSLLRQSVRLRERRRRLHSRVPSAVHAAARVARRPGRESDRAVGHRDRQHRGQPPLQRSGWPTAPAWDDTTSKGSSCSASHSPSPAARWPPCTSSSPSPDVYVDATVLVAANLLATAVRFVLLRGWVFHGRAETDDRPETRRNPFDDDHC